MCLRTTAITKVVMLVSVTLLIIYDIVIAIEKTDNDTISAVFQGWSQRFITLPFGWGVLFGHLVWPQYTKIRFRVFRLVVLAVLAVGCVFVDVFDVFDIFPAVPAAAGFFLGRFLWPQRSLEKFRFFSFKRGAK